MTTELARSIRDCLLRRPDDALVTLCAPRAGQQHERLSGLELHAAALARAGALSRSFDPAAGPLAIMLPCGADFVTTLIGALFAGFTVTALAPPRAGAQTARFNAIIEDCRPGAILCSESLAPRLQAARSAAPSGRGIPIVTVAAAEAAAPPAALEDVAPAADPRRPTILQYTSGSTGAPRGVALHGEAILANASLANRTWGMDEHGAMLSWLPHFHDMGLMGGILYPLLSGGVTMLMDPLHMIQRPDRWLRLIDENRATFSGGPAFAFAHCLNAISDEQCEGLDLSSWRRAFCGAEPVPAALMAAFRARFGRYGLDPRALFASYGLAEYTLMVAGGINDLPEERPAPPAGCAAIEPCRVAAEMQGDLRIVDPETLRPLADGTAGEVWLRGASVAGSYLGDAAETERVFGATLDDPADAGGRASEWLRTGDIGAYSDGNLYMIGRLKDLLFANGQKIPAPEVERLAAAQDPALNPMAAAAFMPDVLATGTAALLIELRRRSMAIDQDAVRRRIRQAVAGTWSIDLVDIRFLAPNTLPRTTSGKIQRRPVAEDYRSGLARAAAA
jgi:acyl-CoA synthetase (AMP-forming)/AMP-acid ligase II